MKKIPEDIAPILDELKTRLREFYGEKLAKLVLFGSRARGDNDPDSDIDVLVVLKGSDSDLPGLYDDVPIEMEFNLKFGLLVSLFTIDESRYNRRLSPFCINVRREGVAIA